MPKANKHKDATMTIQTRKDPEDGFTRTALVIDNAETGSFDVVDKDGKRLCQINISFQEKDGGWLNVDVIDVDERFAKRRALAFSRGERVQMAVPEGGVIVAAEFSGAKK